MKHFESELHRVIDCERVRTAKELCASRAHAADIRRRRRAPQLDAGRINEGQNHESLVADDRIVAFDFALMIRVVPASFRERNVAAARAFIAITIVFGKPDAPTIAHLTPAGLCLRL